MIKKFIAAVLLLLGLFPAFGGSSGNCEEHADSVSFGNAERTVKLVAAYDVEEKTSDATRGVYFFKAKLKRSTAYTIWTTGLSTNEEVSVMAYAKDSSDEDEDGPSADFTEVDEPGGNTRLVMYADDWYVDPEEKEENDPKEWTYYVEIEGEVGQEVNIHFATGAIIPAGREDNPLPISPTLTVKKSSSFLQLDSTFYYRVSFKAGQLYWFATSGGTTNSLLSVDIDTQDKDSDVESEIEDTRDFETYPDPAYDDDELNTGIYVVPSVSGWYNVVVTADGDDADGAPFTMSYRTYQQRKPSEHVTKELNAANDYTSEFVAGHMNTKESLEAGYYDKVVDESLFRFTAKKGSRWIAETLYAQTNMFIAAYDAKGKMLNWNVGDGLSMNARAGFEIPADGDYYVGVCQNISDDFSEEPAYTTATVKLSDASTVEGQPDAYDPKDDREEGATGLIVVPASESETPEQADPQGTDWHELNRHDWYDVFMIGARKGVTYSLRASLASPSTAFNSLAAEVYILSGTKELHELTVGDINASSDSPLTFTATVSGTYYVRISVAGGRGLDYPKYKLHAKAVAANGEALGSLTVNTFGVTTGTFTLDKETVKYKGGSSVLVAGSAHTVKYGAVKGFSAPAAESVVVKSGKTPTILDRYYSDTFDPKDDTYKGATAWTLKNTETTLPRTFWKVDPEDNFVITGKDGQFFDIALKDVTGDAVFTISNEEKGKLADKVTSVKQLLLPTSKAKYYLKVTHANAAPVDGSYTLAGFFANVGSLKLAKTALSVKEDAASVVVTVNRTAKDGVVRIKYGTVAGTAQPGVDYVAQNGILEWGDGDNKPKTITVRLIPDLLPTFEGADKTFAVQLKELDASERTSEEYPGTIVGGDTCTITLKETAKEGATVADAYKKYAVKPATVQTEVAPLESGTFYGVLAEDGAALTNGQMRLASVTFTASKEPAKLAAKVLIAGKTYAFSATGWDEAASDATEAVQTMTLVQKIAGVNYTNTLMVCAAKGETASADDWLRAGADVELTMNVPDANGKGAQKGIRYTGRLFRNNAKIQNYLTAVTNFAGYYTVALAPNAVIDDGVPAGNGYLTLTVDAKGTAKVAGLLADGQTKISLSSAACGLVVNDASSNGLALHVPLFLSKSPYCFGGTLRLHSRADGVVVVDSANPLLWNNDNPALAYDNQAGYQLALAPVGGWYDRVVNLQTYYLSRAFEIGTADVTDYPAEFVATGNTLVADVGPNGQAVDVVGNNITAEKQVLVKAGKLFDLEPSVNPSGVTVKFARATGLVNGTFMVWSIGSDGVTQKQIKGLKFNGVAVLARDAASPLVEEVVAPGFFTQAMTLTDVDPKGVKKTRKWTFSAPFNLLGIDQGAVDWWLDDWGVAP
ncbi:MAG: Calx-beta domain-containing protein [bacterium]|nr:Calx-beta domain-containing protein [bacterium]